MRCLNTIKVRDNYYNCGHCMNCRINYTQQWSLRLIYELSTTPDACFLTLTYDDEHLPENNELKVKDLQDFWKRLRTNLQRTYHEFAPKIRYYAVGEYGSETKRCHYHAIVFGLDNYNDKHREIAARSWPNCESWLFDKSRGRKSAMQEVTPDDINYVTGYVQKKLNGELAKKEYGDRKLPFSVCSQGLGLEFCLKNKERLAVNGWTYFKGHKVGIPRYFADKLGVKRSELLKSVQMDGEKLEYSNLQLFEMFKEDMEAANTWNPDNLTMMEKRYQQWYNNRHFEIADRIYQDFRQKQKLKGVKL